MDESLLAHRFVELSPAHRAVLLRMVADACRSLHCWGTSCTAFTTWHEVVPHDGLAQVCRDLVAKGLILSLGEDDLGVYRPTVAGIHLVVAWLQVFLVYPPVGVCADA